jgi:DNA-binding response OmpR family regulator
LIVDDDPWIVGIVGEILSEVGYWVIVARTGEEAIAVIRQQQPALILLDLHQSLPTGEEVIRDLRRRQVTLPIVTMTAAAVPPLLDPGLATAGKIAKRFEFDELLSIAEHSYPRPNTEEW